MEKGRQTATRDTDDYSSSTCYLPSLLSLCILSNTNPKILMHCLQEHLEKMRNLSGQYPLLICLHRGRVRRKRNPDSRSLNEYPTASLYISYPTSSGKHTELLFSLCSQVPVFSTYPNPTQPSWLSSHLSHSTLFLSSSHAWALPLCQILTAFKVCSLQFST